ncbi:MAG: hypothetical protein NXI24_17845 [bacterium]|nr:hypothetical protein [bacterium]
MALNAGITAPNPHNTQAWKFRVLSPGAALLFVDETRILPVTDPTTRQIHIGQGCLLALVEIAASRLGYRARIDLFPGGTYRPERDLGRRPVARITLNPDSTVSPDPLFGSISRRHTVRASYSGPLIMASEFLQLQRLIRPEISRLDAIRTPDEISRHISLHMAGFEREVLTRRTAEESRIWFRIGTQEIFTRRDGISLRDNGVQGFERWMLESFFLSKEPEAFHDRENTLRFLKRYRADLETARGILHFVTPGNQPADWVRCGKDYARFQLAATQLGLVSRPMSQLLQEYEEMRDLAQDFESLTGVSAPAKVQMVALLGRGEVEHYSPRRSLETMLE